MDWSRACVVRRRTRALSSEVTTGCDTWLRRATLRVEQPSHPLGQPQVEHETDGHDLSVFAPGTPSYDEVLVEEWSHLRYAERDLDAIAA